MNSLHPRVRVEWILSGLLAALVLAIAVALASRTLAPDQAPDYLPFVVGGIVGTLGVMHAFARFDRWRYDLQEDAVYLERGVLTQVETVVPFVRVQHVDTQRGPIDRLLGLASVVVYTAGSRGADVTVPGLTPERADELRNRLHELAIESEPDDGV